MSQRYSFLPTTPSTGRVDGVVGVAGVPWTFFPVRTAGLVQLGLGLAEARGLDELLLLGWHGRTLFGFSHRCFWPDVSGYTYSTSATAAKTIRMVLRKHDPLLILVRLRLNCDGLLNIRMCHAPARNQLSKANRTPFILMFYTSTFTPTYCRNSLSSFDL
jgi:hypothetical protein